MCGLMLSRACTKLVLPAQEGALMMNRFPDMLESISVGFIFRAVCRQDAVQGAGCAVQSFYTSRTQRRNAPAGKRPFGLGLGTASAALHRLPMRGRDTLLIKQLA